MKKTADYATAFFVYCFKAQIELGSQQLASQWFQSLLTRGPEK